MMSSTTPASQTYQEHMGICVEPTHAHSDGGKLEDDKKNSFDDKGKRSLDGSMYEVASLGHESTSEFIKKRSKVERRFLRKLDLCLIAWAWSTYVIKIMDGANYKTAYASGMKEDLSMYGLELNFMDTTYRIGYAIMVIPSQIILTKVRPSMWLPGAELLWGLMTGLMAACHNVHGMYALRFFIGLFEASAYPGIICVLCSWYTPRELAARIAIFGTSYPAANMFVGFMQAALHTNMNGVAGLSGWRWLFVFNALMTAVVALFGHFMIPDDPVTTRVRWLNDEEKRIALLRMNEVEKLPPTRLSWSIVKKIFTNWVLYVFCLAYSTWSWAQNSNSWIVLFLKAEKNADGTKRFGISQLNMIPIIGYAIQMVAMVGCAWGSGRTGKRWLWIFGQMLTMLVGLIILVIWPKAFSAKMVGYYLLWLSNGVGPILVAWMADLSPSPEVRSIIVGVAVTLSYVVDSWLNVLVYPAREAPRYRVGYKVPLGFTVVCMASSFWFHLKAKKRAVSSEKV
ncbi:Permease of the major facilitator superfamily [Phaffia rhodozyma]|uniref:Permease of the major facilitator superfamily n=1 Tax=Phaffia rhodozyma TaxID=264483 RepID=A0A0F7SYT2_PHARH|nr:Permease of the major facilitator superfamily [Phaffia rhodozyma]